ncbi:hypothetical protein O3G_MSEX008718 [Manduca sexta]|uniref:Uncharacterized protein n=1 Tax=Manduca sexta TaxID=7130 RepID=A0A921ZAK5_MANSE|nr:hypothetical protein O3G_MSEX008718 [Manduca sexta]
MGVQCKVDSMARVGWLVAVILMLCAFPAQAFASCDINDFVQINNTDIVLNLEAICSCNGYSKDPEVETIKYKLKYSWAYVERTRISTEIDAACRTVGYHKSEELADTRSPIMLLLNETSETTAFSGKITEKMSNDTSATPATSENTTAAILGTSDKLEPEEHSEAGSSNTGMILIILFSSLGAGIVLAMLTKLFYTKYKAKSYAVDNRRNIEMQNNGA